MIRRAIVLAVVLWASTLSAWADSSRRESLVGTWLMEVMFDDYNELNHVTIDTIGKRGRVTAHDEHGVAYTGYVQGDAVFIMATGELRYAAGYYWNYRAPKRLQRALTAGARVYELYVDWREARISRVR